MADSSSKPIWPIATIASVMGILAGSFSMYQIMERRIETRVEQRLTTELKLQAVESSIKAVKDACWSADEQINVRMADLHDRVLRLEANTAKQAASSAPAPAAP